MATLEEKTTLLQLGVGMFNMALGKANLEFLEKAYDGGMTLTQIAGVLSTSTLFTSQFEGKTSNEEKAEVLASHYGLTKDTINFNVLAEFKAVKDFFTQALDANMNLGEVIIAANNALTNDAGIKAALPTAAKYLANTTEVAKYYSIDKGISGDEAQLSGVIAHVDATDASVTKAKADIDSSSSNGGKTFYLTTDQDILTGTSGDDTFVARGNNSLNNADIINGGSGTDTVKVMLDKGETAESPLFTAVEILKVQAQAKINADGDNDVDGQTDVEANIDAGDMESVVQYWNEDSRADLTIEDVSRDSDQVTIGMRETDPGDVDYNVYFDKQNIVAPTGASTGGKLILKVADLDKIKNAGNNNTALEDFPYDILFFTFNNVDYSIDIDYTNVKNHDDFVAAINTALKTAKNITNDVTGDISGFVQAQKVGTFTAVHPDGTPTFTIPTVELVKTSDSIIGDFAQDKSSWEASGKIPGDTAYYSRVEDEDSLNIKALTMTNVILDRVGKNSEGGDLVIGNDSTNNVGANQGSGSKGIQQFNVDVDRDSWLTSMSSTNNTLEVVNVENISDNNAEGNGSLTLGSWDDNGEVDQRGLVDVRVFDAAGGSTKTGAMKGDVKLTAELTENVVEKYLKLKDSNTNPGQDNSEENYYDVVDTEFSYDFGSGNDNLDLLISNANLAKAGTTTREDFELEINGNDGDDTITTMIGDGTGVSDDNWVINHVINSNLTVNTGNGNDTVNSKGAGNWTITTGAGNDTVYTDNTGDDGKTYNDGKATWVLNTVNQDINDLQSEAADTLTGATAAVNAFVTITFRGIEVEAEIADSYGKTTAQTITDLQVNQAIKKAINENDVLNKLLVAEDGPARSLVITSKIDGVQAASDLTFEFSAKALTTAQTNAGLGGGDLFDSNDFANGDYDVALNTVTNAKFAQETPSSTITIGAAAVINGTVTATINGTEYSYDYVATATAAQIAAGLNAVLNSNGVDATVSAGVVTVNTSATITTTSTDVTVTAVVAPTAATNNTGADSTAVSDNKIELGTGDDVLVLGTDDTNGGTDGASNDTIVYKGYDNGNDTIVNFIDQDVTTNVGADVLDFTSYLGGAEATAATTDIAAAAATLVDNTAYELSHSNAGPAVEFSELTASKVQGLLNGTGTASDSATIVSSINATSAGDTDYILIVENAQNLGEYKFFHLESVNTSTDFSVKLIGTADFGASQDFEGGNIA